MKYPPKSPQQIASVLKKDCGVDGGIRYADSIAKSASSQLYRQAYREAKRILIHNPESVS